MVCTKTNETITRFWNDSVRSKSTIYHSAFRGEIRLALSKELEYDAWGAKLMPVLRALGYDMTGMGEEWS